MFTCELRDCADLFCASVYITHRKVADCLSPVRICLCICLRRVRQKVDPDREKEHRFICLHLEMVTDHAQVDCRMFVSSPDLYGWSNVADQDGKKLLFC